MVLMSDGEYNSAYADGVISKVLPPTVQPYINYTQNNVNFKAPDNADSFTQAKAQCDAIKATGIELYVITFQLIKTIPDRVSLVTYCATDAAHLIDGDAGGLDAAFTLIANNIKNLRLTN